MPSVSCEDKIRWEVFRPLSSPLNSVVSFSAAPHQKGKNKTREGETERGKFERGRETIMYDGQKVKREDGGRGEKKCVQGRKEVS